ncbi:LacI family DNA-binding transcriptional regulator [Gryllotalpicola kribbensis]|uniref:LacI family DNA-binding transcriptional regulator n=1 Tax=Gryllotalpicola kribbensis TaxID=993084 RepID=A0ABP8AUF0_9MICO
MSPRPAGTRPTLSLVAQAAGTSVPTVSKVLRGGTDVSAETRAKVMDAVHSVGYTRRPGTKVETAVDEGTSSTALNLVVTHLEGSWANQVLVGVGSAAAASDLDLIITLAQPNTDWASRILRRRGVGVVGALLDPASPQFSTLVAAGVPMVLLEPMSAPPAGIPAIGVANWDAGRTAAEQLLALGHRHMGVIAGYSRHIYSRARVDGFRSAVDAAAGDTRVTVAPGQWDEARAAADTHKLLDRDPAITAIFACSDPMALGVYNALAERGLRIPDDVSVIGFDDLPEAHWISPTLTTMRQPSREMGDSAVRMLLDLTRPENPVRWARPRIEMSAELVVRASTGPARAAAAGSQ